MSRVKLYELILKSNKQVVATISEDFGEARVNFYICDWRGLGGFGGMYTSDWFPSIGHCKRFVRAHFGRHGTIAQWKKLTPPEAG